MADFLSLPGDIADRKDAAELELERFLFNIVTWDVLPRQTLDAEWRLGGRAGSALAAGSGPVVTGECRSAHAHMAGDCLAADGDCRLTHAHG